MFNPKSQTEETIRTDQKISLTDINIDTIVIGGGPAGLALSCALKSRKKSFMVIESGKKLKTRKRSDLVDIVSGIGGAGLFSDGKFSFYPSATRLWNLNRDILMIAYSWYQKLLQNYHVLVPEFPVSSNVQTKLDTTAMTTDDSKMDKWYLKGYPSIYLSLDDRYNLIDTMCEHINNDNRQNIMTETEFISYKKVDNKYVVKIKNCLTNEYNNIKCNNIVISAGRMWPLFHQEGTNKFMRFEYGIRIQDKPEAKIFESTDLKDPKYIYDKSKHSDTKYQNTEYRTFCCCRRGEIVKTNCGGILTCSGRSDCEPTEHSNIGFNVRIMDEKLSFQIKKTMAFDKTFEKISMIDAIENNALTQCYGELGNDHLKYGLKLILNKFPDLRAATLSGPTLEGVGSYPVTDENLKMINENIWIIGDACGKFRGITAGMISGYYVGCLL